MKRFLALAVAMTFVVTACGGDDPLTPGAVDDPSFEIFSEEYDQVDGDITLMAELAFDSIDGVFGQTAGGVHSVAGEFGLSLEWDAETSSWIGTFNFVNEHGASVTATSTLQFCHGTDAVQFRESSGVTAGSRCLGPRLLPSVPVSRRSAAWPGGPRVGTFCTRSGSHRSDRRLGVGRQRGLAVPDVPRAERGLGHYPAERRRPTCGLTSQA